jgi:hypothetical protein
VRLASPSELADSTLGIPIRNIPLTFAWLGARDRIHGTMFRERFAGIRGRFVPVLWHGPFLHDVCFMPEKAADCSIADPSVKGANRMPQPYPASSITRLPFYVPHCNTVTWIPERSKPVSSVLPPRDRRLTESDYFCSAS